MPLNRARLWDRLSWTSDIVQNRDYAQGAMNKVIVENLDLRPGHAVVDVGCGAGPNFPALREAIGPSGSVLGIDLSPRMLQRAQQLVDTKGWDNVETVRADLTSHDLGEQLFDRAIGNFSISATSDVPATLTSVHRALRPGGKLFVADLRLVPTGWSAPLLHLFRGVYRTFGGWTGVEVLDALGSTFDTVEVVGARHHHPGGWPPVFTAVATR